MTEAYKEDNFCNVFCDDAKNIEKYVTKASVNAIITDPPAGIGLFNYEWDDPSHYSNFVFTGSKREAFVEWLTDIFTCCRRVATQDAVLVTWTLPRTSHWTAKALLKAGWHVSGEFFHVFFTGQPKSQSIVNKIKKTINSPEIISQWTGWGTSLKPNYEKWLVAHLKPQDTFFNHYCYCKKISARERNISADIQNSHPSLKTIALMQQIIDLYTQPNDSILDPFMGSGTTGVAALGLGRSFMGIEASRQYFEIAQARLGSTHFEEIKFS